MRVIPKAKLQKFTLVSIKVYHLFGDTHFGPVSISVLHEVGGVPISGNHKRLEVTDLSNNFIE